MSYWIDEFDGQEQYDSIHHALMSRFSKFIQEDLFLFHIAYLVQHGANVPADKDAAFVCLGCGKEYAEGDQQWSSVNTLYVKGKIAGYIHIWHCRDCDPYEALQQSLSDKIQLQDRKGEYSDAWKAIQGNLD